MLVHELSRKQIIERDTEVKAVQDAMAELKGELLDNADGKAGNASSGSLLPPCAFSLLKSPGDLTWLVLEQGHAADAEEVGGGEAHSRKAHPEADGQRQRVRVLARMNA